MFKNKPFFLISYLFKIKSIQNFLSMIIFQNLELVLHSYDNFSPCLIKELVNFNKSYVMFI